MLALDPLSFANYVELVYKQIIIHSNHALTTLATIIDAIPSIGVGAWEGEGMLGHTGPYWNIEFSQTFHRILYTLYCWYYRKIQDYSQCN